jgi:hypothetical protein
MEEKLRLRISRRAVLKLGVAAGAGLAGVAARPQTTQAHDLKPTDPLYQWERYEEIVNRPVVFRQLYQWPTLTNPIFFSNVRNGINGFQFSYGIPADSIQVVVQAYGSANAATYDDYIWEKYRWGEALNITDPDTKEPATRNIFYPSKVKAADVATPPSDATHAYYADTSIEGLQRRGVLFLC